MLLRRATRTAARQFAAPFPAASRLPTPDFLRPFAQQHCARPGIHSGSLPTFSGSQHCFFSLRQQEQRSFATAAAIPSMSHTEPQLRALKVAELKERLRQAGLPVSGNKNELIQRLLKGEDEVDEDVDGEKEELKEVEPAILKKKRAASTKRKALCPADDDDAADTETNGDSAVVGTDGASPEPKRKQQKMQQPPPQQQQQQQRAPPGIVSSKAVLSFQLPARLETPQKFCEGPANLRILNWNVNGLRAALGKGLDKRLTELGLPDVVCLSEIKAEPEQIDFDFTSLGYKLVILNPSVNQKGYAGTAVLSRIEPISVQQNPLGVCDDQGRVIAVEYEKFWLINTYVPNSGEGLKFAQRRAQWDKAFLQFLLGLRAQKPVLWTGDLNVAYYDFDVYDGEENPGRCKSAGFTHEERRHFHAVIETHGMVDAYRSFFPHARGAEIYTFWSMRAGMRAKQRGWRLDYFIMSPELVPWVCNLANLQQVMGSDHSPQLLEMRLP